MKITAKQYAQYFYQAISDSNKEGDQIKIIIKKFVELLAEKNQLVNANKIIREFEIIWDDKNGFIQAEIKSANKLDKEIIELLKNYIIEMSKAKQIIINEKVDKKLLGGIVIKYKDKILDGSLKNSLQELKVKLIKN